MGLCTVPNVCMLYMRALVVVFGGGGGGLIAFQHRKVLEDVKQC